MKQKGYSPIKSGFAPIIILVLVVLGLVGYFAYKNYWPTIQVQPTPTPSMGRVFCKNPRPQVCTMECIQNPPYICGSDGKSYCTACQACSNKAVTWYEMKASPCEEQ